MPNLTVGDVRNWTEDRFYERGEQYYRQDRIQDPKHVRDTGRVADDDSVRLKAVCEGSRPEPYRLEAVVGGGSIRSSSCSCPAAPRCKHLVALLLTWIDAPDTFAETRPLRDRLLDQSKEALVDLIDDMIRHSPSLAALAEIAAAGPPRLEDADESAAYEYVAHVINAAGRYDIDGGGFPVNRSYSVAGSVEPLLDQIRDRLDASNASDAERDAVVADTHAVVRGILTALIDYYDDLNDREGYIFSVTSDCVSLLADALGRTGEGSLRTEILKTLYRLFGWDLDQGRIHGSEPAVEVFQNETTPDEKMNIAGWIRDDLDAIDASDPRRSDDEIIIHERVGGPDPLVWRRRQLGRLLLDLVGDRLDDEDFVALCRQANLNVRLAAYYVDAGAFEDAVDVARRAAAYALRGLLDHMVEAGAGAEARELARDRLSDPPVRPGIARWLYDDAMDREDYEEALDVARLLVDQHGGTRAFDLVLNAARPLGREDEVRDALLDRLLDDYRLSDAARFALHAGNDDRAVQVATAILDHDSHSGSDDVVLTVANAVATDRPDAAVDLYDRLARRCVARRGRDNYRFAADVFAEAFDRVDDAHTSSVQDRLDALVEDELGRLPAARDEFGEAGLL